jgi:hypothetical protein
MPKQNPGKRGRMILGILQEKSSIAANWVPHNLFPAHGIIHRWEEG